MSARPPDPFASVVVPCCDEEESLEAFYERTAAVLDEEFGDRWEIVFVDDGSTDRTGALIRDLNERNPRVRGVCLSKNFGSHAAIAAGIHRMRGDLAIIMAADLQDPPEALPEFVARWREGYEIAWGARESREDPFMRRVLARLFWGMVRRTALPGIPATGTGSFCLVDRTVVDAIRQFPERNRLTFGLISWAGYSQTHVPYRRAARFAGRTKWSVPKLVKNAVDAFVSFSYLPLRLISYLGLVVSVLSFIFGIYVVIDYLANGTQLRGWPSLMAAILFLGGVQLVTLGVVGEYVWRISEDTKSRPLYLVRELIGDEEAAEPSPVHARIRSGEGG